MAPKRLRALRRRNQCGKPSRWAPRLLQFVKWYSTNLTAVSDSSEVHDHTTGERGRICSGEGEAGEGRERGGAEERKRKERGEEPRKGEREGRRRRRRRGGSGQSAWDYPQGSRLFAHATDTDDAVTPTTAVSDCLVARASKNKQQLKLRERVLRAGGANPPFSVFLSIHGTAGPGVPPGRVSSLHCPSLSYSDHP